MRKIVGVVIGAVALMWTACQSSQSNVEEPGRVVYKGVLPAADCPGIVYDLTLIGDSVYSLDMTYIEGIDGKDVTFSSTGNVDYTQQGDKRAVILKPSTDEVATYFLVINDSTLRMVNDSLQEIPNNLNYDLIKQK